MTKRFEKLSGGIFLVYGKLCTKNIVAGQKVYGEELLHFEGKEYRAWNPHRSKIAAAITNGLKNFPIKSGSKVLYLGCAEGTTVSHLSDIVQENGVVFGVDISAKVMNKFLYICSQRKNLVPILADAAKPESYRKELEGIKIGVLFQDISQKEQVEIFLANAKMHLKKKGTGMLSLKARSINSFGDPKKILEEEIKKLGKKMEIKQIVELSPFQKDHVLILCEKT